MKTKLILLAVTIVSVMAEIKWSIIMMPKTSKENKKIAYLPKGTQKFFDTSNPLLNNSEHRTHIHSDENISYNHKPCTFQAQDHKATRISFVKPNNLINHIQQTAFSTQKSKNYLKILVPLRHEEVTDDQKEDSFAAIQQEERSKDYEFDTLNNSTQTDPDFAAVSSIIQTEVIKNKSNNVYDNMKENFVTPIPKLLDTHLIQEDKEQIVRLVDATGILEDTEGRDTQNKDRAFSSVKQNEIGNIQTHIIFKRNVIEEENLASTVSGVKFTGAPESRLSNKLNYNNINE